MQEMTEEQYLKAVVEQLQEKLIQMDTKLEDNARDMEQMDEYFWENYAEFDEYGYEMYDNKQAMKTRLTQQETYKKEKKRYLKMMDSPYFGRVDFCYEGEEEPEIYYIGTANLAKERAALPMVFDWRAPVAGLFYDYDKGLGQFQAPAGLQRGVITRKRQYKIRHGALIYALENEINIDDEILQQTLSEHADAKLKSIVTTIQKEQNSIIRDVSHRLLAVQGCAGSGKTSVALHRIAYLLYHNRDKLKAAQILILSPNSIFGDYISRILPELGEENICEMTLDDYAYRELRAYGEAEDRYDEMERLLNGKAEQDMAGKQSRAYLEELDRFILQLEWEAVEIRDFSYKKMFLSEQKISKLFYEKFCEVPIFSRMDRIADYLIDAEETLRGKSMADEEKMIVVERLKRMYRMTASNETNRQYEVTPERHTRLFEENCQEADILYLYNQFLEQTGRMQISRNSIDQVIPYEDVYPLLYLKLAVSEQPKRRRVKHLVIDEMQDYSYLQYTIIQKLFDCPMTILGDKVQTMAEHHQDVMKYLPHIFGKEIYCVKLEKSYRSTTEITDFAASLIGQRQQECMERHGESPMTQRFSNRREMLAAMAVQLQEQLEQMSTVAVLCLDAKHAERISQELKEYLKKQMAEETADAIHLLTKDSMKFTPGISVMPFYLAKGLEFDTVLVPDAESYTEPLHKQALYINATRALHILRLYAC